MEVLKILRQSVVSDLRSPLMTGDQVPSIYTDTSKKPTFSELDFVSTSTKVLPNIPKLKVDCTSAQTRAKDDVGNALLVCDYLGSLNRTQASDVRLWVTLTHTKFWDYCFKRWPVPTENRYVLEHWFEKKGGGLGALRRNAISRLWWAAKLTVAPWEKDEELAYFKSSDRAKYTHILLSQQQIFFDVLERNYGSNDKIRICLLDALGQFLPKVRSKDALSKAVVKKLSLVLNFKKLDLFEVEELHKQLCDLVESCV